MDHTNRNTRKVFIIHGRNRDARDALFTYLRALDLEPIEFDKVSAELGGAATILSIVREGMDRAQAIVALFTPDELAFLSPRLQTGKDAGSWRSRPNVMFEAGMAIASAPDRTFLVVVGPAEMLFSDVHGIHYTVLDNSPRSRGLLRDKLQNAGCAVNDSRAFLEPGEAGNFENCVTPLPEVSARSPFHT